MFKKLRDFLPLTGAVLSMAADVVRSFLAADVKRLFQGRDRETKRGRRGAGKADRANVVRSRGRTRHH